MAKLLVDSVEVIIQREGLSSDELDDGGHSASFPESPLGSSGSILLDLAERAAGSPARKRLPATSDERPPFRWSSLGTRDPRFKSGRPDGVRSRSECDTRSHSQARGAVSRAPTRCRYGERRSDGRP